jgi:hypothetical protein
MTFAAKRSTPRVRFSIFARTALITAAASVVVAASITVLSFRTMTDLAYDGLRAKAEAVTTAIAAPVGPRDPLRADGGARDGPAPSAGDGSRRSGRGLGRRYRRQDPPPDGSGSVPGPRALIAARGEAALSGGKTAVSLDDVVIAVPVTFGDTGTIVGAVSIAWSADPALALDPRREHPHARRRRGNPARLARRRRLLPPAHVDPPAPRSGPRDEERGQRSLRYGDSRH